MIYLLSDLKAVESLRRTRKGKYLIPASLERRTIGATRLVGVHSKGIHAKNACKHSLAESDVELLQCIPSRVE